MDLSSDYSLSNQQMINTSTLDPVLVSLVLNLQNEYVNGNMSSNEVPEAIIERFRNEMKRKEFIDKSIAKYGEPTKLSGKYERWGWRPFGYKGLYVIAGSKEEVYDRAWQEFKKQEEEASLTLSQAVENYCKFKTDVKGSTRQKYRDNIKMFLEDYLETPLNKLTALQIEQSYKNTLVDKKPHKTTVKGFRGTLERVLKHAKKHYGQNYSFDIAELLEDLREGTNKKLLKGHQKPQLFQTPTDRYTLDEAVLFIQEAIRRNTLKSLGAALLFFTGARISETCGSYKEDYVTENHIINVQHAAFVDKETNIYYIDSPKEDKERIVVYPDKADVIIENIQKLNKDSNIYMFPEKHKNINAEWLTIRQIDDEIADICDSIGIERKSAHDIRRTYDSILDEATMPSALRHLLVGHELSGIDAHYLRDNHTLDEVREIINKAFEKLDFNKVA